MSRYRVAYALLATVLTTAPLAEAVTIGFAPSAQTVPSGSPVNVDLVIAGLSPSADTALGAFDLNVSFDPTILSFNTLTFGSFLGNLGLGEAVTGSDSSTPGLLNLFEVSLLSPAELQALQSTSFVLATLGFTAAAGGSSALGLTANAIADEFGNALAATLQSGSLEVTSVVPEPATLFLLSSGLAGFGLVAWRRRVRR